MKFIAQRRFLGWSTISPEPRSTMDAAAIDIAYARQKGDRIVDYRIIVEFEEE